MSVDQISYNIRFFRDQQNWTQKELAEKLSTSRSVVAKWESNTVTPDVNALIKLSNLFSVSLDHLTGNHTFRDDLLKDFKRIYSSPSKSFDEDVVELVEYLMTHPKLKKDIYRLKDLSNKKQQSIHNLLSELIDQIEQI
ncbi:helix-turn-helix domain-containing protein [Virgibacillus sp. SK37]|uniref:helix-turn-helix domain-containing protein n=1 Tax=Virgibacillus sp. SK37 TaxID=403957 RepID=UPI0005956569|nr:helix-turn-helix transcriptional regulator [Virgibacillus sp. SK37]